MSHLRDDWMVFSTNVLSEEGDPIIQCDFKTELTTHLMYLTQASIKLTISPIIEYAKKRDKKAEIKFVKDETIEKGDVYKYHTVWVPSGEPPDSVSRPPVKGKPGVVRPIIQRKLLKVRSPFKKRARPKPTVQPLPGQSTAAAAAAPVQPKLKSTPTQVMNQVASTASATAPHAVAPAELETPIYKAKYAFEGQDGEMPFQKNDLVELLQKDDNGWWLVKKDGEEGWAPNNYLELLVIPNEVASAAPIPTRPVPIPMELMSKVMTSSVAD